MAKSDSHVDLSIDARLMAHLVRYARQHGTTVESLLLQSVIDYLEGAAASEPPALPDESVKRLPRKEG